MDFPSIVKIQRALSVNHSAPFRNIRIARITFHASRSSIPSSNQLFLPSPSLFLLHSSFILLLLRRLKLLAALFKKTTFVLAISRQRQRFPPASLKSALFVHRVEFSSEFSFPRRLSEREVAGGIGSGAQISGVNNDRARGRGRVLIPAICKKDYPL